MPLIATIIKKKSYMLKLEYVPILAKDKDYSPLIFSLPGIMIGEVGSAEVKRNNLTLTLNDIFSNLPEEDGETIFDFYYDAKDYTTLEFEEMVTLISTDLLEIEEDLELSDQLVDIVEQNYNDFPDLSLAGTMEHHEDSKTFYLEDYVNLTALSLLSKLLYPIQPVFLDKLSEGKINPHIQYDCLYRTYRHYLDRTKYADTLLKLQNRVNLIIIKTFDRFDRKVELGYDSLSLMRYHDIKDTYISDLVMGYIFSKKFFEYNANPLDEDLSPDIVKWILANLDRFIRDLITGFMNSMISDKRDKR